jgi:hypothetical protein
MGIRSLRTASISTGAKRSKIWDQSAALPNGYESIATQVVGSGGASSITFSSIPNTYKHLQLRMSTRTDFSSSTPIDMYLELNGDTSYTGYRNHRARGDGAAAIAGSSASYDLHKMTPAASSTASVFSGIVVDLFEYANTNKTKTVRYLGGADLNGSGHITFGSILWPFTSAVNQIKLLADGSFVQHSSFALYGIKG